MSNVVFIDLLQSFAWNIEEMVFKSEQGEEEGNKDTNTNKK